MLCEDLCYTIRMNTRSLKLAVPALLQWYQQNKRDLPWRKTQDPYHIWVSEIMLQQTRVEAVKGYYQRFLQQLPDIAALAAAPEKKEKKVSKFYKFVKPEPYVQMEQINFLNEDKGIHSKYLLDNTFVVFDLETTGLNYSTCKIIEIGAVKIVKGQITEVFSTFVNPQGHIDDDATLKNNITDDMVKDAPVFNQVFPDFFKFIDGAILVAHNISFDLPFISHHAKPLGYTISNKTEDTLLIAQKYLWQLKHYKLSNLCDFLGVSLVGAHRAVNDTVATAKCFVKLIENYQDKENN